MFTLLDSAYRTLFCFRPVLCLGYLCAPVSAINMYRRDGGFICCYLVVQTRSGVQTCLAVLQCLMVPCRAVLECSNFDMAKELWYRVQEVLHGSTGVAVLYKDNRWTKNIHGAHSSHAST